MSTTQRQRLSTGSRQLQCPPSLACPSHAGFDAPDEDLGLSVMCRHCTHSPRCVELLCVRTRRKGHCEKVTAAAEVTGPNRAAPPLKRLPCRPQFLFFKDALPHTARRHRPNLQGKRFRDCACRKHSLMSCIAWMWPAGLGVAWACGGGWVLSKKLAWLVSTNTLHTIRVCTHSHPLHCLLDVPTFLGAPIRSSRSAPVRSGTMAR